MGCFMMCSCSGATTYVNPAPKSPLDVLTPRRILRTSSVLRSMARLLGLAAAVGLHWNLFRFGSAVLKLRTLVAWNTYWFRHRILRMLECFYHSGLPTIWECGPADKIGSFRTSILGRPAGRSQSFVSQPAPDVPGWKQPCFQPSAVNSPLS